MDMPSSSSHLRHGGYITHLVSDRGMPGDDGALSMRIYPQFSLNVLRARELGENTWQIKKEALKSLLTIPPIQK
jgi:hypothetical protein